MRLPPKTARWKRCVPRLALINVWISKGFYLHSLQLKSCWEIWYGTARRGAYSAHNRLNHGRGRGIPAPTRAVLLIDQNRIEVFTQARLGDFDAEFLVGDEVPPGVAVVPPL